MVWAVTRFGWGAGCCGSDQRRRSTATTAAASSSTIAAGSGTAGPFSGAAAFEIAGGVAHRMPFAGAEAVVLEIAGNLVFGGGLRELQQIAEGGGRCQARQNRVGEIAGAAERIGIRDAVLGVGGDEADVVQRLQIGVGVGVVLPQPLGMAGVNQHEFPERGQRAIAQRRCKGVVLVAATEDGIEKIFDARARPAQTVPGVIENQRIARIDALGDVGDSGMDIGGDRISVVPIVLERLHMRPRELCGHTIDIEIAAQGVGNIDRRRTGADENGVGLRPRARARSAARAAAVIRAGAGAVIADIDRGLCRKAKPANAIPTRTIISFCENIDGSFALPVRTVAPLPDFN